MCFNLCSLLYVYISPAIKEVDRYAFRRCDNLESITVDSDNPNMTSVDGVLMTKDMKKIIRCPQAKTSFTVPDGVTTVGYDAFEDCHINKLIFPESATKFEDGSINLYSSLYSDNCEIFFKGHLESFGDMNRLNAKFKLYVKSSSDKEKIMEYNDNLKDNIIVESEF